MADAATEAAARSARVAVAIPCFNEAPAIAAVIAEWRARLPDAEIVVIDNNSDDGTGRIAVEHGARVIRVPEPGKGHAVRAIFAALRDRDAVILIDGDGTYPAEPVLSLLGPVLAGVADTAVGARQPMAATRAMAPVRGLGNVLIRWAFRLLIGPGGGDLLSGYRVFGPRFLQAIEPRSSGFEIEAELASETVARGFRAIAVPVPYRPRHAGTVSKLRAVRDGRRIVLTLVRQSVRLRFGRLVTLCLIVAALLLALAATIHGVVNRSTHGG